MLHHEGRPADRGTTRYSSTVARPAFTGRAAPTLADIKRPQRQATGRVCAVSPSRRRRDRPLGLLARADRQEQGHLAQAVLAHLVVDLVGAGVRLGAHAGRLQPLDHLAGVAVGVVGDRRDHHLHRRQPQRQPAGIVLDQHADEALERAEDRPVQHHRPVLGAVLADVVGVQPLRQHEVDLQRAALPVAADRVAQHELELRPVEGALAGVERALEAGGAHRLPQRGLGLVPDRVRAGAHRRPVGELHPHVGRSRSRGRPSSAARRTRRSRR